MSEPTTEARQIAFNILTRHPPCLRDDVSLNHLIDDIATAIGAAAMAGEQHGRIAEAAKVIQSTPEGETK